MNESQQSQIPHIPILLEAVKSEPADENCASENPEVASESETPSQTIQHADIPCASISECHESTNENENENSRKSPTSDVAKLCTINECPKDTELTPPNAIVEFAASDTAQPNVHVKQESITEKCTDSSTETQYSKDSAPLPITPLMTAQNIAENTALTSSQPPPALVSEILPAPIIKEEHRNDDADIQNVEIQNGDLQSNTANDNLQPHLPPPQTKCRGQTLSLIKKKRFQESGDNDLSGLATPIRYNIQSNVTQTNRQAASAPLLPHLIQSPGSNQISKTTSISAENIKQEHRRKDEDAILSGIETPVRYNIASQRTVPPLPSTEPSYSTALPLISPPTVAPSSSSPTPHNTTTPQSADAELNSETFTDNFFDDLLQDADAISAAIMSPQADQLSPRSMVKRETSPEVTEQQPSQSEGIPTNFFDDILVDYVAERLEEAVNQDIELKYSERLKELQKLEEISKSHKKHKKKKKKSHKHDNKDKDSDRNEGISRKRSRHKSQSPNKSTSPPRLRVKTEFMDNQQDAQSIDSLFPHKDAQPLRTAVSRSQTIDLANDRDCNSSTPQQKLLRVKSEFSTFAAVQSSPPALVEFNGNDLCLPLQEKELFTRRPNRNGLVVDMAAPLGFKRIKLEKDMALVPNIAALVLTPKAKRELAYNRAIVAIEEFKKANQATGKPLTHFVYTSVVRKLPSSNSYLTQQIYENRSPLHKINNVNFKFNSHVTHYNLREWGIEAIPNVSTKVAKILGYDALTLHNKLKSTKLPLSLQKLKQQKIVDLSNDANELCSTFLINSATQTDEVTILSSHRRNGFDIGVQATPHRISISTQTEALSTTSTSRYDDLPLMQQIGLLNENQLMALSDFAELIRESANSAMDMYRLRQRMLDIYKCSQLPSAMPSNQHKTPGTTHRNVMPKHLNYDTNQEQHDSTALPHSYAAVNPHYQSAIPVAPLPTSITHGAANYANHNAYQHMPYVQPPVISYPSQEHQMAHGTQRHPSVSPHGIPAINDPRYQQSQQQRHAGTSIYYGRGNIRR